MTSTNLSPFVSLLLTCRTINAEASPLLATQPVIAHFCQREPASARFSSTFPMYCACTFPKAESQGWRTPKSRTLAPMTKWPQLVALYKWPKQPTMPTETLARLKNVKLELSWNMNPYAVDELLRTLRALTCPPSAPGSRPFAGRKSLLEVTVHFSLVPSSDECQLDSWEFFHNNHIYPQTRYLTKLRNLLGELHKKGRVDWGITMGLFYPKGTNVQAMRSMGPWPACDVDMEKIPEPRQLSSTRSRCGVGLSSQRPVIHWSIRAERNEMMRLR